MSLLFTYNNCYKVQPCKIPHALGITREMVITDVRRTLQQPQPLDTPYPRDRGQLCRLLTFSMTGATFGTQLAVILVQVFAETQLGPDTCWQSGECTRIRVCFRAQLLAAAVFRSHLDLRLAISSVSHSEAQASVRWKEISQLR